MLNLSRIYDNDRKEYRTNIYSIDAKGSGAGGAFTTVLDVEKFWNHLLNCELISKEYLTKMLSPQIKENYYGYGVWLLNGKIPSFQGCDPGTDFITSFDSNLNVGITIISNFDYDVERLHDEISNIVNTTK